MDRRPGPPSRRRVLRMLGGLSAAGASGGLAGCLGSDDVSVLAAGSLAVVLERTVGPRFARDHDRGYRGEYHGSKLVTRMIRERQTRPDIAITADVALMRDRLEPEHADWDVVFAANEVGLAYAPGTPLGRRLAAGQQWYAVLRNADEGEVAIADPDLDPLGYRAMHLFELAEQEYGLSGFREEVAATAYREPHEPQLLAGVESGSRSVAVVYRSMASDHDLPFRALPDRLNFGSPAHADHYATASYTTDDGYTARGSPMLYAATVLRDAPRPAAGRAFVRYLLEAPGLLRQHGVAVPADLPRFHGDAPEGVR